MNGYYHMASPQLIPKLSKAALNSRQDELALSQLRLLVETLPSNARDEEQILLDVEMDGDRYILIRQPVRAKTHADLSPREQEIARMVAAGYPNKVIADVLEISAWTVCTYVRRMFAKLNVSSHAAMVAKLHKDGILR